MAPRKLIAYVLFGIALFPVFGMVLLFFSVPDPKGFGSLGFAAFFLLAAGWLIGDF